MPNPNQKSLHARIATLSAEVGMMREIAEDAGRNRKEAEAKCAAAHKDCAELKRLLAEAREEIAGLNGYIRHGHEMDDAASERVAIEVAPPTLVPRTRLARQNGHSVHEMPLGPKWYGIDSGTEARRAESVRHWTEIG